MSQPLLHVIGVGPGDPELLTFKAARLIAGAEVVAYPVTESGKARAREIAAAHIGEHQVEVGYVLPMRKERDVGQAAYEAACERIQPHLEAGLSVALLCEGDPFFYGSAMYIHARLAARYETRVVPGVTSLTASAAATGRPLAARNDTLIVLPAPLDEATLAAGIEAGEAIAIIKVGRHFAKVRRVIDRLGLTDKAILVESATLEDQAVTPLSRLDPDAKPYFSTILVYKGGETWL